MKLRHFCIPLLTCTPLAAQSVGVSLSALTPLTAVITDGVVSGSATFPAGPMAMSGAFEAYLPSMTIAGAGISWQSYADNAAAVARLEHYVWNPSGAPAISGRTGPNEFLVEWSATAPVSADLRILRQDGLSPGVGAPTVQLDFDNDGTIDVASVPITIPLQLTRQFGPQPLVVRVILDVSLNGGQHAATSVWFFATPHNDLTITEVIANCRPLAPPPPPFLQPSFVGRGVMLGVAHDITELGVIVVGTSPQPALLGLQGALPCILLPTPEIVLYHPTGWFDLPLPASLRPITFYTQGVIWSNGGLITTEGYAVTAF
jgi:hypothetical protein